MLGLYVDMYRLVGAYEPGSEKTKEVRKTFYLKLGELLAGCETDEVKRLMVDLPALVD